MRQQGCNGTDTASHTIPEQRRRGFTIVELLVVVSIIGVLMAILLPAIASARDQARLTISKTNLRQLGQAHATYASEWNDRQFTVVRDDISRFGNSPNTAMERLLDQTGSSHPGIILGWGLIDGASGLIGYWMDFANNRTLVQPIDFNSGFGWFRIPNTKTFSSYLSGKYYDPVFYAPKDTIVQALLEDCQNVPAEFTQCIGEADTVWSSYCLAASALYSPDIFRSEARGGWQDPWSLSAGFRAPSMGMARYSELKTHMAEHHWLQNARADCNGGFEDGTYDGCEPYYFNLGWESVPSTLFYDGHVGSVSVRAAIKADERNAANNGEGLWSRDTPFGDSGYFQQVSYDEPASPGEGTSFHVLTTHGIRGRDILN